MVLEGVNEKARYSPRASRQVKLVLDRKQNKNAPCKYRGVFILFHLLKIFNLQVHKTAFL